MPSNARRALLVIAVALVAATLALVAAGAAAVRPHVRLPRDHYGHPRAGIEWWYVTGVVRGADGHRYSVFFTLFSRAGLVVPVSQVIDLNSGANVGHSETVAPAAAGNTTLDVAVPGAHLGYRRRSNTWSFSASAPGYALDLTATPEKRYVLHGGGTGVIKQSIAGPSAYYSATRMAAHGSITTGASTVTFAGTAWFDHQWGNFVDDPRAFNWDWFSCRFDDRTELMLYRFRDRAGTPLPVYRSGTFVLRNGRSRPVRGFEVTAGTRALDAAGRRWPLDWELRVPSERLSLRLSATVDDQLFRGTLVPTFWEGATTATGSKTGVCFVEETYR